MSLGMFDFTQTFFFFFIEVGGVSGNVPATLIEVLLSGKASINQ